MIDFVYVHFFMLRATIKVPNMNAGIYPGRSAVDSLSGLDKQQDRICPQQEL